MVHIDQLIAFVKKGAISEPVDGTTLYVSYNAQLKGVTAQLKGSTKKAHIAGGSMACSGCGATLEKVFHVFDLIG